MTSIAQTVNAPSMAASGESYPMPTLLMSARKVSSTELADAVPAATRGATARPAAATAMAAQWHHANPSLTRPQQNFLLSTAGIRPSAPQVILDACVLLLADRDDERAFDRASIRCAAEFHRGERDVFAEKQDGHEC
jgi:hypothetical protein